MNNNGSGKHDRALIRVIKFSSATGLGTMAAILYSVKQVTPVLRYEISFGTGLSFLLAVELLWALGRIGLGWFSGASGAASVSSVALIGNGIFTRHAFAFEATSVLILVAMIGAVVLARREQF